ncbi:hypothetical protein ACFWCE_28280, partial [Bacillus cereus]|uniref:hypothetical protein n=1 Tax=Bacillus cereus TaxID=1396 RepID=UPI003663B6B9
PPIRRVLILKRMAIIRMLKELIPRQQQPRQLHIQKEVELQPVALLPMLKVFKQPPVALLPMLKVFKQPPVALIPMLKGFVLPPVALSPMQRGL